MVVLVFAGLVVVGVALAVWRSGASHRNRDDLNAPVVDGGRDRSIPGGDGGFGGVSF